MKKLFFSALAIVAFAGSVFASNEVVVEKQSEIEKENIHLLELETLDTLDQKNDCLLKITIYFKDGSSEVRYVLVTGASCEEILGPSKSTTITPSSKLALNP